MKKCYLPKVVQTTGSWDVKEGKPQTTIFEYIKKHFDKRFKKSKGFKSAEFLEHFCLFSEINAFF